MESLEGLVGRFSEEASRSKAKKAWTINHSPIQDDERCDCGTYLLDLQSLMSN